MEVILLHLLFDFIIILILLFFVVTGKKKGFVLTLCGLVALIIAFVGASLLARYASPPIAQAISPQIVAKLETYIQEELPDMEGDNSVYDALKGLGFYDQIIDDMEETISDGTEELLTTIASTVALSICYLVIFLVTFVLVLVGWYFLSHTLNFVFKLPGLNLLNTWGGAVLGLVRGCLILFVFAWAMQYFGTIIAEEVVAKTYLLKFFMESSPTQMVADFAALGVS